VIRTGLIAAALLLASVVLATAGQNARAAGTTTDDVHHRCSAVDKQFIEVARLNLASVTMWGADYVHGDAAAADVIGVTRDAYKDLAHTAPLDPSLAGARRLYRSMFVEYGRAIRVREDGGDASPRMYRAYSLGEFAHQVLALAAPKLGALGCPVDDLL
jgi:hypothetical protein